MSQKQASPAWASTAVGELLCGRRQDATVLAATRVASYLSLPDPGSCIPLLALLSEQAVRLPIGVVIAAASLPEAGSTVRIGEGSIVARDRTWRPVRWWDPRPHLVSEDMFLYGPRLLEVLESEPPSAFGFPLADALGVASALAGGDAAPALEVIGFGPGLTPAGDDAVAGALAVLALCGGLHDHVRIAVERHGSTRTTALSAALLAAASKGQVIPQAAAVLAGIASGAHPARLRSAVAALFDVGATSGHDLCAGMAGILAGPVLAGGSRPTGEGLSRIAR